MELPRIPIKDISPADLRRFFLSHLNRIYCAKNQLVDKLPLLVHRSYFLDLQQAIAGTIEIVELQIERIKQVYIELDTFYQPESCIGLVGLLDEAFQSIGGADETAAVRDLSIIFYMQNIESIETASFKVMTRVADKLASPDVAQLLLECYDDAREDKALFLAITEN
jgi:ferritin-like metal-binding protein YciE